MKDPCGLADIDRSIRGRHEIHPRQNRLDPERRCPWEVRAHVAPAVITVYSGDPLACRLLSVRHFSTAKNALYKLHSCFSCFTGGTLGFCGCFREEKKAKSNHFSSIKRILIGCSRTSYHCSAFKDQGCHSHHYRRSKARHYLPPSH